jgi:MSHA pilin protein MshA
MVFLSVTALPKFIDLSSDAKSAAVEGVAGAASSAMAVNYAGCAAKSNVPTSGKCVTISTCEDVGSILQGGLPTGYTAKSADTGGTDPGTTNGSTSTCKVKETSSTGITKNFTGIAAGN